jgi:hypothetical protein
MARVTYESKDNAGHKFWVACYGRYAVRIDATRRGVYPWLITLEGRSVHNGVAPDRDQAADAVSDALGGEQSTRQSLQSAMRAPGVGDEGGPSSPTTLPVSPASLGGSQGHAPDLLKNDSGAGPVTASSLATVVTGRWPCSPAAARTSAGRAPGDFFPARERRVVAATCGAGRRLVLARCRTDGDRCCP